MSRYFIFLWIVLCSPLALALQKAEITFESGRQKQIFIIEIKKDSGQIRLKQAARKEQATQLKTSIAKMLLADANEITWISMARKPASQKTCSEYATIKIDNENRQPICLENQKATGRTYGFLNQLAKYFKN